MFNATAWHKQWRQNNRDKCKAYTAKWKASNPDTYRTMNRKAKLKMKYGLSLEDYDLLFAQQNGKCAICKIADKRLAVDHNHETGQVRGLLCSDCNKGLGLFKENLKSLESSIEYLRRQ